MENDGGMALLWRGRTEGRSEALRPLVNARGGLHGALIAENGMILRVQVGSGVHGISITGQDDRDEMGLCLEPPQFVTGPAG